MEIRPLDSREAVRGAIETHGQAWQEAYAGVLPDNLLERVTVNPGPAVTDSWLERLPDEDEPGLALGAQISGTVRGYIFVRWGETKPFVGTSEAGLKEVYVHPDWWGGGLGTELVGRAVDALPPTVEALTLETLAENDIGRAFYESRGFAPDGHDEIAIGDGSYETVIYRRPLDGTPGLDGTMR